jgi:hypothetical protein
MLESKWSSIRAAASNPVDAGRSRNPWHSELTRASHCASSTTPNQTPEKHLQSAVESGSVGSAGRSTEPQLGVSKSRLPGSMHDSMPSAGGKNAGWGPGEVFGMWRSYRGSWEAGRQVQGLTA